MPIAQSSMVRNVGGNCGFASIEIIARHQGYTNMHGFANGKGGSWPEIMATWLNRYGVEHEQVHSRTQGLALMRKFLEQKRPVLFSIPGHALVCCGWTWSPQGDERIWVVDNTGYEACVVKGWPKREFDARFDGWVCGLWNCRPFRPNYPPPQVTPGPGKTPHIDPPPDLISPTVAPQVTPPAPAVTPNPQPCIDLLGLKKLKADLEADKAAITAKFVTIDQGFAKVDVALKETEKKLKEIAAALKLGESVIVDLSKKIDAVAAKPGPAGPAGPTGPQGPPGPQGRDGKTADVASLMAQVDQLKSMLEVMSGQMFEAELLDSSGKVIQRSAFGPGVPLKLKLIPVK